MDMQRTETSSQHIGSNMETEMSIGKALELKRQEFEREFAEFKASKEKEFAAFEQRLRATPKESANQDDAQHHARTEIGNKPSGTVGSRGQAQASGSAFRAAIDTLWERALADMSNQDRQRISLYNGGEVFSRQSAQKPYTFDPSAARNREVEFQGLFTPSYLPLLDGSCHMQKHLPKKPSFNLSIQPAERRSSPRNPASTFPPSTIVSSGSPPVTRSLSETVLRDQAGHHERPSSSSVASGARRRSSLRDPTQPRSPKSPKHVLFSIDNVVVSPHSSPGKQHRSPTPHVRLPAIDNVPRGFENVAAGKTMEPLSRGSPNDNATFPFAKNPPAPPVVTSRKPDPYAASSYHASLGTGKSYPRRGVEGLKFGMFDDDLFKFDEDLDLGDTHTQNSEDSDASAASDDEDEGNKEDLPTACSPHAGSLPIEIKWPTRRDRKK
jgi:hypothetical protein